MNPILNEDRIDEQNRWRSLGKCASIDGVCSACQYIIPEALREFRGCFPSYSLSIVPGDSAASLDHVLSGTVDLALMLRTENNRKIVFHPLFDDELQLIISALHP